MAVLYGDQLAAAVLSRLRAAAAGTTPPLAGIYIPPTRQQEIPADTLAAAYCLCPSTRGAGRSKLSPEIEDSVTLHIDGFVAQGRSATTDLDQATGGVMQAILDLLLEDETFIGRPPLCSLPFGWVESVNTDKQEPPTGKDALERDIVEFRIELVLAGIRTVYTPTPGVPLQTITTTANLPGAAGPTPVVQQFNPPQS
jgi:hypothetical protein